MTDTGMVIWITGLSAAGKTTLAHAVLPQLRGKAILLDGDDLRSALQGVKSGYDVETRRALAMAYARLANMLAKQGAVVVVAAVALFHDVHKWNRRHQPRYVEVFLDVPEDILKARDPKGLYKKAQLGELKDFLKQDIKAELPLHPDVHITREICNDLDKMTDLVLTAVGEKQ